MVSAERMQPGLDRAGIGTSSRRSAARHLAHADTLVLCLAFCTTLALEGREQSYVSLGEFLAIRVKVVNIVLFAALLVTWRLVQHGFGLYRSRRGLLRGSRIFTLAVANGLNTLLLGLAAALFEISVVDAAFLLTFWLLATVGSALLQGVAASLARLLPGAGRVRNVLVVGTNEAARRFGARIKEEPEVQLLGYCSDFAPGASPPAEQPGCVTDFKNFPDFLRANVVDEVVVGVPLETLRKSVCTVLPACEALGVTVHFLSNTLAELGVGSSEQHDVLVTVYHGMVEGTALAIKRALDFSLALLLLLGATPLLGIAAVLIRLESPGPTLFRQVRVGLHRRPFNMYKLRTMCVDAEVRQIELESRNEVDGAAFKIEADPRVTRVGRYLRQSSLDELPQLLNVLRGEMSLVGPRPLPLRDFARFDVQRHGRRFSVYPGISGLWQVSGRSSLSFEDWMELDLRYVDDWSLGLDLLLIAKTVPAVVFRVGAS